MAKPSWSKMSLVAIGLAIAGAFVPATAEAAVPCASRAEASVAATGIFEGAWTMTQSNGFVVRLDVKAPDADGYFGGTAVYPDVSGTIATGWVGNCDVVFEIDWNDGRRGRYVGTLGTDGQWSGTSVDLGFPQSQARWAAQRV